MENDVIDGLELTKAALVESDIRYKELYLLAIDKAIAYIKKEVI